MTSLSSSIGKKKKKKKWWVKRQRFPFDKWATPFLLSERGMCVCHSLIAGQPAFVIFQ